MGQDHSTSKSSRRGAAQQKPAESTPKDTASIPAPAPTTSDSSSKMLSLITSLIVCVALLEPAAKKTPVPEPVDIVITATASDSALVTVLKSMLLPLNVVIYHLTLLFIHLTVQLSTSFSLCIHFVHVYIHDR